MDPAPQASCHGSVPLRVYLFPAPVLTVGREGRGREDAGCGTASTLILASWDKQVSVPRAQLIAKGRDSTGEGCEDARTSRGHCGPQSPKAPEGAARTYLQPGVPVAAAPSDGPVASAGRRQSHRSCIASETPVRWHHPGA